VPTAVNGGLGLLIFVPRAAHSHDSSLSLRRLKLGFLTASPIEAFVVVIREQAGDGETGLNCVSVRRRHVGSSLGDTNPIPERSLRNPRHAHTSLSHWPADTERNEKAGRSTPMSQGWPQDDGIRHNNVCELRPPPAFLSIGTGAGSHRRWCGGPTATD
jgi:hypothetical protein